MFPSCAVFPGEGGKNASDDNSDHNSHLGAYRSVSDLAPRQELGLRSLRTRRNSFDRSVDFASDGQNLTLLERSSDAAEKEF